jgi:hypothetical protein
MTDNKENMCGKCGPYWLTSKGTIHVCPVENGDVGIPDKSPGIRAIRSEICGPYLYRSDTGTIHARPINPKVCEAKAESEHQDDVDAGRHIGCTKLGCKNFVKKSRVGAGFLFCKRCRPTTAKP